MNSKYTALSLACALLSPNAIADTEITIYNQDLALIKTEQKATLTPGINEIVFKDAAQSMLPESAFIFGNGIKIIEQNYDYAGIDTATLLTANIGKTVKTVRINEKTGENIFETATLVAANGFTPVLKFDYGIETNFPGRVIFDNIPQSLNPSPVFKAKAQTATAGEKSLNLVYLASGFSWSANYVAKINNDETLSLLGRVSINNNSGSSFKDISASVIAGDVNTVSQVLAPRMFKRAMMNTMAMGAVEEVASDSAVISAPSSVGGYYVYKMPEKISLKNGQIKQISFIDAPNVKYKKHGRITSPLYFAEAKNSFKDLHPEVIYNFTNQTEDGLGLPLPKGKISFYDKDKENALQFVGENTINDTAVGQHLTLQAGRFFDVFAKGQINSIQKQNERELKTAANTSCPLFETTYIYDVTFEITNNGEKETSIILKQNLPAKAEILTESLKSTAGDNTEREWRFSVAPKVPYTLKISVKNTLNARRCPER